MTDNISKTERWLDLIGYLIGRWNPVPISSIMKKVPGYAVKWRTGNPTDRESARHLFQIDKKELKALGIPIDKLPLPRGNADEQDGYVLGVRDFFLPYLKVVEGSRGVRQQAAGRTAIATIELAPEAIAAALDALRFVERVPGFPYAAEARSALRKLALGAEARSAAAPDLPLLFLEENTASDTVAERVRLVSDALLARKRVRFRYHGIERGETTGRDLAPYGLMFLHGHWYVVGDDALRGDIRVFRVDRMADVEVNGARPKSPDYEIPPDFRLRDHVGKAPWALGPGNDQPLRALVRFGYPSSLWAERNEHGEIVEQLADGSAVRAFDVRRESSFVRWVLSLEGEATILEPAELADAVRHAAGIVARAHGAITRPEPAHV